MRESIWGIMALVLIAALLFVLAPGETVTVGANNSTNTTQTVHDVSQPIVTTLLGVGFMACVAVFIGAFIGGEF